MKLNIHSRPAKLYRAFYNKADLPNNLCNYFWSLIIAIVCAPLTYPGMLINLYFSSVWYDSENKIYRGGDGVVNPIIGFLLNAILFCVGVLTSMLFYGDKCMRYIPAWKIYLNGIGTTVICLLSIILFIAGIMYLVKNLPEQKSEPITPEYLESLAKKERERQARKEKSFWYILKKQFKAWKDRNCPIIEWTHEK